MTELEAMIKKINTKFKTGEIKVGVKFSEVEKVPFSSFRLNYMTYGGIPVGRLVEFSGADGSGKTTTALDLVGNIQRKYPKKRVFFVDIEGTFDSVWARKLGVDIENIILYRPDSQDAEEVFQTILDIMNTGDISLCVLDSIGAMVSGQANEKDISERTYGGISQSLTLFSRKAIPICARTGCIFLGINQIRDDMNSMYGGTVTTGGKAWRHNCSTRLSFRKGNFLDEKGKNLSRACENPVGNLVNVALDKSKVCPPDRKVGSYTLNYMTGIESVSDAFDVAVKEGLIKVTGAWCTMVDATGNELVNEATGEIYKFNGRSKTIEFLREDTTLYNYLIVLLEERIS